MARSSFYYHQQQIKGYDKYQVIKEDIKSIYQNIKVVLDSAYGAPIQQIEETQQLFDFSEFTTDEIRELLNED